ncbi:MAG: YjjG family noncanonical pyrimidine nucleotidase [Candidatus Izemoplasma sp.]|nr:YjjG family noncanonical pyrimidine nucleotidase [Candidatus Izemoplasma sp.]
MKYNVILFDADGTLFDFHKAEEIAFQKAIENINTAISFTDLFNTYLEENHKIWRELERGQITQEKLKIERFERFIDKSGISADAQTLANTFMSTLSETSILYEDALNIVKQISHQNTVAIITNGLKEVQGKRVRNSVLKSYVKTTVISDELGIQKPDPRIIDHTLDLLGHKTKNDVVIIGDSLTSDIQGGINAGIDTIWYNPTNKENHQNISPTYTIKTLSQLLSTLK